MEVQIGAICPYCGKGNAELVRIEEEKSFEAEIYKCKYCGKEFVLLWVKIGEEDVNYSKYELGGFGAYCPKCGSVLEDLDSKKIIVCPVCGERLENPFGVGR